MGVIPEVKLVPEAQLRDTNKIIAGEESLPIKAHCFARPAPD